MAKGKLTKAEREALKAQRAADKAENERRNSNRGINVYSQPEPESVKKVNMTSKIPDQDISDYVGEPQFKDDEEVLTKWQKFGRFTKNAGDKLAAGGQAVWDGTQEAWRWFKDGPAIPIITATGSAVGNTLGGLYGAVIGGTAAGVGAVHDNKKTEEAVKENREYEHSERMAGFKNGAEAMREGGWDPAAFGPFNSSMGFANHYEPQGTAGAGVSSAVRTAEFQQMMRKNAAEIDSIKSNTQLNHWNAYRARAEAGLASSSARAVNQRLEAEASEATLHNANLLKDQELVEHRRSIDKSKFGRAASWAHKAKEFLPWVQTYNDLPSTKRRAYSK